MTTATVDQSRVLDVFEAVRRLGLREPVLSGAIGAPDAQRTMTWDPDLSPTEQELLRAAVGAVRLTSAERSALQADIDGLIAYQAIASPTLAQTASATKAQNRILRAILRS